MNRIQRLLASAVLLVLCAARIDGATITMSVDGVSHSVPHHFVPNDSGEGGKWFVGADGAEAHSWGTSAGNLRLQGMLDSDPSIIFAGAVTDFGAPSNFTFTFVMPLIPIFSNPSIVSDSLAGGVTNGNDVNGVTVTASAPPIGIPVDADGVPEIQVFTLSDDGGITWKNVGLDSGPTTHVPLGRFNSGFYGAYAQGPIATIPGGPWTHMRADISFGLSGNGDTFTFSGAKVLVPEPGSMLLVVLVALASIAACRYRTGQP